MIKFNVIVQELRTLISKGAASEASYQDAVTYVQEDHEKALFIHLWQEHAKMVVELEDKVRWLGGMIPREESEQTCALLRFKGGATAEQMTGALLACERADMDLLQDYEYVVQMSLPVDVRILLMFHITKLKGMLARVREALAARRKSPESVHHRWAGIGMQFQARDTADGIRSQVVLKT